MKSIGLKTQKHWFYINKNKSQRESIGFDVKKNRNQIKKQRLYIEKHRNQRKTIGFTVKSTGTNEKAAVLYEKHKNQRKIIGFILVFAFNPYESFIKKHWFH